MKNLYNNVSNKVVLAVLGLFAVAGIVSCDTTGLTDTLDEFGVVVELEPINTTTTVLLYDAVSGELIEQNVNIDYSGENGDDVIDVFSDPIDESTVSDGILGFGIDNSVTPSESNPAEVRLILEADGYISKAQTIRIRETGESEFEVEMIRESTKPQGVKTTQNTKGQADASGAVQEDFTMETTASDEDSTGITIEVASGTVFQDADGNALTGQLTSSVTFYDPSEPSAMASVPVDLTDEEGNPIPILGGAAIEVRDANGRRASGVAAAGAKSATNHELNYRFQLTTDIISTEALSSQNSLKVVYYDNDFTRYTVDGSVVEQGELFFVTYTASVIPVFAYTDASEIFQFWDVNYQINRNGNSGNLALRAVSYGFNSSITVAQGTSSGTMKTTLIANETNYIVRNKTRVLASEYFPSNQTTITLNLEAPPANTIDATINLELKCSNGGKISTTDLPGASVLYRKQGAAQGTKWAKATDVQFRTNADGTALTGGVANVQDVEQGATYNFKVNFDGETYIKDITITGPNVTTDYVIDNDDVCV